jgi:hypothetical protein
VGLLFALVAACSSSPTPPRADGGVSADGGPSDGGTGTVQVGGLLKQNTEWTANNTYVLTRPTVVVAPAVLTIRAGTTIRGDAGSYLLITRGAKIMAEGTDTAPIVFTSSKTVGTRARGDWGGVVVLGRATINVTGGQNAIEGIPANLMIDGESVDSQYGANDDSDNSGVIRYVRIEFAGFELSTDNELNGLTLGGVGAGTTVDYVQVHRGADDGIECFGGTVNLKHIVISHGNDDGLDLDFGYRGKVQFGVVLQDDAANEGYEWDNNGSAQDATPRTMPTVYNMTLVGSKLPRTQTQADQNGMVLRRGVAGHLYNHIVMGFQLRAADVRDSATVAQTPDNLGIHNSIFFENGADVGGNFPPEGVDGGLPNNDNGFDEAAYFLPDGGTNRVENPMLTDPYNKAAPNLVPQGGSPVMTGGATPPNDGFFDTTATYIGAFGTVNWMAGWTAFPAN